MKHSFRAVPNTVHLSSKTLRVALAAVLALALLGIARVPVATAATITVTTTQDELDVDGNCSLREAIRSANLDTGFDACPAGSGADQISLPAGTYVLSLAGPPFTTEDAALSGDLDISRELTIGGAGSGTTIIDASGFPVPSDGIVEVLAGASVRMSGLTLQGSRFDLGIRGGGIWNSGDLVLHGCVIRGNQSESAGGIGNSGRLAVSGSTISGNSSRDGAGGIRNSGTLVLEDSTVADNIARDLWAGIYNSGSLTLRRTQVRDNRVVLSGIGGIGNDGAAAIVESAISGNGGGAIGGISNGGTLQFLRSTLSGNDGLESGGIANQGTLEFDNSTVSGNSGGAVGGIMNVGTASVASSTVAENTTADLFPGTAGNSGGIANVATLTLANTIVADNIDAEALAPDCIGTLNSRGYNLVETPTGCTLVGSRAGNVIGVDPGLGSLADNGGPTETQALLPGSRAVDAGSPAGGRAPNACPSTDQRGVARPQDGNGDRRARCDIGAYELASVT